MIVSLSLVYEAEANMGKHGMMSLSESTDLFHSTIWLMRLGIYILPGYQAQV